MVSCKRIYIEAPQYPAQSLAALASSTFRYAGRGAVGTKAERFDAGE
jgi:hypothetical protein